MKIKDNGDGTMTVIVPKTDEQYHPELGLHFAETVSKDEFDAALKAAKNPDEKPDPKSEAAIRKAAAAYQAEQAAAQATIEANRAAEEANARAIAASNAAAVGADQVNAYAKARVSVAANLLARESINGREGVAPHLVTDAPVTKAAPLPPVVADADAPTKPADPAPQPQADKLAQDQSITGPEAVRQVAILDAQKRADDARAEADKASRSTTSTRRSHSAGATSRSNSSTSTTRPKAENTSSK